MFGSLEFCYKQVLLYSLKHSLYLFCVIPNRLHSSNTSDYCLGDWLSIKAFNDTFSPAELYGIK